MKKQHKQKGTLPEYAKRIAHERTRHRLSQKQLAEILAVGPSVTSSWELGKYPPSSQRYAELGNLFTHDAIWFWEQAGIDRNALLIAAARLLVDKGFDLKPRRGSEEEAGKLVKEIRMHKHEIGGHEEMFLGPTDISIESASRILILTPGEVLKLGQTGELELIRIVPTGAPVVDYDSVIAYASKLKRAREVKSRGKKTKKEGVG